MTIEERMVRRDPEDIIEIGRVLEVFYETPAASVLRAIVSGRINVESKVHREDDRIKPSRALGRIEAYQQILDDIELAIAQYHSLIQPLPAEEENDET